MGSGFSKMKKQARMMQQQYEQMREELQNKTVTGTSEGELVSITLDGEHKMRSIKIKPECVDPNDIEGLEDLIRSAYESANKQLDEATPDPAGMLGF